MAEHTKIIVEAHIFKSEVGELKALTKKAVHTRQFTKLFMVVNGAEKLKQTEDIEIVDATAIYNRHKIIGMHVYFTALSSGAPFLFLVIFFTFSYNFLNFR